MSLTKGLITKINKGILQVKCEDNSFIECISRGKLRYNKVTPLVGDKVLIDKDKKVIESIDERKNFLQRPPVANIDKALIVTSVKKPNLSLILLDKLISIVTINNIEPIIIFTKLDLLDKDDEIDKLIKYYKSIGIKVFKNTEIEQLKKYLNKSIVTVCGQTGAGKSTLINKLDETLNLNTHEISKSLGRGIHTTRIVELFEIDDFYIVDTPGFSAIDINIYTKEEIKNSFIELRNQNCKYKNCNHLKEDGCLIKEYVNKEKILKSRYDNYKRFMEDL